MSTPMAETTSAPSLRELSERAPQGEWTLEEMPNDAGSRSNAFTSFGIEADGKTLLDTLNATGMYLEQEPDGDGGYDVWDAQGKAVIEYVLALVQAHRAGRLIDLTTLTEAVAAARAEGWQLIETAPRDRTRVIVAVPSLHADQPMIVGEAYFNPDHEDGTWWWAGTTYGDYYAGPIHDTNAPPTHWQPLPAPPRPAPPRPADHPPEAGPMAKGTGLTAVDPG